MFYKKEIKKLEDGKRDLREAIERACPPPCEPAKQPTQKREMDKRAKESLKGEWEHDGWEHDGRMAR